MVEHEYEFITLLFGSMSVILSVNPLAPGGNLAMLCTNTDCTESVQLKNLNLETLKQLDEHFSKKTLSNLVELAVAVKSRIFHGNGGIRLVYRGGRVTRLDLEASTPNEDDAPIRDKK